jgi:hypothetical protein
MFIQRAPTRVHVDNTVEYILQVALWSNTMPCDTYNQDVITKINHVKHSILLYAVTQNSMIPHESPPVCDATVLVGTSCGNLGTLVQPSILTV